jgi:N6-adenosine-specific RNA methylase IME4
VNWPFDPFRPFSFDVIAADPPWTFDLRSEKGEGKAPQAHYDCMSLDAIKAMPVGDLARGDCWLFLWTCAPMLDQAFEVMRAWGFKYKSRITWRKTTVNGKVRVGPGYIVRSMTEDVLIGAVGAPVIGRALPSVFDGLAREHSRKPDEFFALVEDFAPAAFRLDLFSRQTRPGWANWGDEATKFDGTAQ